MRRRASLAGLAAGAVLVAPAHAAPRPLPPVVVTVVADRDADGRRDAGEPAVGGVRVVLQRQAGRRWGRVRARTTATSGRVTLRPRRTGRHRLRVAVPRGFTAGPSPRAFRVRRGGRSRAVLVALRPVPAAGPLPVPSPAPAPVPPPAPQPAPEAPAPTAAPAAPPAGPVTADGVAWRDSTPDGIRADAERRLQPTVQAVTPDRATVLATTTADAAGAWTLQVPGTLDYRICLSDGSYAGVGPRLQGADRRLDSDLLRDLGLLGCTPVHPAGTPAPDVGAALTTPVGLGDKVFRDGDADGLQGAGEPGVAGVRVQLWEGTDGPLVQEATSDGTGRYRLSVPSPGTWRLRLVDIPFGAVLTSQDVGADDQLDSDAGPDGWTPPLTLAPNLISTMTWDFGLRPVF